MRACVGDVWTKEPQQLILILIFKAITNIICVALKLTNTMFPCKYCAYTSNWSFNLIRYEKAMNMNEINQDFGFQNSNVRVQNGMFSCKYCTYTSNWSSNLHRQEKT